MIAPATPRRKRSARAGFALVVTLIMVVLAAIIVITFLINASTDRTTSTSFNYRYQATIAAQNGLEAAKKTLVATPTAATSLTGDDSFLVVRVDAPAVSVTPAPAVTSASYYYLAKAQPGGVNKIDYYPLFSGGTPTIGQAINLAAGAPPPAVTSPTPPPNPNPGAAGTAAIDTDAGKTKITKVYPAVSSWLGPPSTQWVELHDPSETATAAPYTLPYQRYTFWVEDLAGYLDASVIGNTADPGNANKRPLYQSPPSKRYQTAPSEIALFTVFDSALQQDSGNTGAKDIILNRELQFTLPTLRRMTSGTGGTDVTSPYLATRLQPDSELPLVPYGYGYTDEGKSANPKLDVNQQVSTGGDPAVKAIAKKINDNLPTFGAQRKGGLTGLDYVNTIAASIIDYADTDSDATIGVDYRGIDSYPLVSEIYSTKNWTQQYQNPAGTGPYYVTITVDWWVELWNMSNQVASGTISLNLTENHPIHVGSTAPYSFGTGTGDLHDGSTVATTYPSGSFPMLITMQPNEYRVLNVKTDTFQLNSGVTPPDSFPAPSPASQSLQLDLSATQTRYELTWKGAGGVGSGAIVDKSNGGIVRLSGALSGPHPTGKSNRDWRGSLPGFIGNKPDGSANYYDTVGDPRIAYYWACPQAPNSYPTESSMWGRNIRYGVSATPPPVYKEVKPTSWPDRGHDSKTVAAAAGTATKDPAPTSPIATESTKAPALISNVGTYSTVAELGNIYDPGQWNITPDANNRWTDIVNTTLADGNYGGGMTLRIGRPEFTKFDQPGLRAWQLLDLFYPGNRVNTRGLVNINTASRDVLRALGAGVLLNRDPDISFAPNPTPAPGFYPPFTAKQADVFADAVIAARPFLSAAQLNTITVAGTSTPLFGNPSAWSTSLPSEWNDSGAEEYFAKVFPLATVRSRNFRIFVTGQALDKNGHVLSTVSKSYQVYLNPTRDSAGKINQKVELNYETESSL